MKSRLGLIAGAGILSALPACGPGVGIGTARTTGSVDGVSYEVRGRSGEARSQDGPGYREFIAGPNTLRVTGAHITANGKDAGEVKKGDSVLLDADGLLTVNGQKR